MTEAKKEPSAIVVPFGKHKGTTVAELLAKDPAYADWILAQGWVAERFAELHAAIMTRGAGTDDTPEHNAIQAKFLDRTFVMAFLLSMDKGVVEAKRQEFRDSWIWWNTSKDREQLQTCKRNIEYHQRYSTSEYYDMSTIASLPPERMERYQAELKAHKKQLAEEESNAATIEARIATVGAPQPVFHNHVEFEHRGVDVVLKWAWHEGGAGPIGSHGGCCAIEIKPSFGDDFPTIMRQMRRLNASYLLAEQYTGRAVPLQDLRRMFGANGVRFLLLREIEAEIANARALIGDAS